MLKEMNCVNYGVDVSGTAAVWSSA